jgi:5-methylcytosine-specific restriction endonuclease McrA
MPTGVYKRTEEHRAKIAAKMKVRVLTEEHKSRIAASHKGKRREPFSDEWRARLSAACLERKKRNGFINSEQARKKTSAAMQGNKYGTGHVVSEEHRERISQATAGEKHYNWKGGKSSENEKVYASRKYREWRTAVFSRDGYKCLMPGCCASRNLQAHHIKTKSSRPDLIFDLTNGITLCKKCHSSISRKETAFEELFTAILVSLNGRLITEGKEYAL